MKHYPIPLLAALCAVALVTTDCLADPRTRTNVGISEDGVRVGQRKIVFRWRGGEIARDPQSCARGALAALKTDRRLQRGALFDGSGVWGQSDITSVLAWCVPRGADSTLFAIIAGPDPAETERFDELLRLAQRLGYAGTAERSFENTQFSRTSGAQAGEQALTLTWGGTETRRESSPKQCQQAAQAAAENLRLTNIWVHPGLVSGGSPNGRAFVVCFGRGGGTILKFAAFGSSNAEVRELNSKMMESTLKRLIEVTVPRSDSATDRTLPDRKVFIKP